MVSEICIFRGNDSEKALQFDYWGVFYRLTLKLTIMQIEKYQVETTIDSLIYTFESVGKTTIKKVVEYTKINPFYIG